MHDKASAEPVLLSEYDKRWPGMFENERTLLDKALGSFGPLHIEHVGSTAIPGIPAKPVVDIMIGLDSLIDLPKPHDHFWSRIGYEWGHGDDVNPSWYFFIKRDENGSRKVHLHIVPYLGQFWTKTIVFRDTLRRDPKKRTEYKHLKERLAIRFARERLKYVEGKSQFVEETVAANLPSSII